MAKKSKKEEVIIREGEYVPKSHGTPLPDIAVETDDEIVLNPVTGTVSKKISLGKRKKLRDRLKKIRLSIIIVAVAIIALIIYVNRDSFSPENIALWFKGNLIGSEIGDGFPVDIHGSIVDTNNFASDDGNIAVLSNTNFTLWNSTGKELVNYMHNFENPVMSYSNGRYLIYNVGSKNYCIISSDNTIETYSSENTIASGTITKNGAYAIISQPTNYASNLEVYTSTRELQYSYNFSTSYATSVELNEKGTIALVSAINSADGSIYSSIYYFDLSETTPKNEYVLKDNIVVDITYNGGNNFYAIGDSAIVNFNGSEFSEVSYEGKRLTAYSEENGKTIISLTSFEGGGECSLYVYGKGTKATEVIVEDTVKSISAYGASFSVLTEDAVYSYHINGQALGTGEIEFDTKAISLESESKYFVLGSRTVSKHKIK